MEVERSAGSFLCCLLPEDDPAALGMSQHHELLSFVEADPHQFCPKPPIAGLRLPHVSCMATVLKGHR